MGILTVFSGEDAMQQTALLPAQDCSQRISSVVTTEQQEINAIPIKTVVAVHRTRIARNSGARQTSFLAHLGSVLISKPVCGEVSTHEPQGKRPCICLWKRYQKTTVCRKPPSTTPRTRCQNCRSKDRPPSGQNCGHRAPNAHRADNERSVDLLLRAPGFGFHLESNMPKCRRANSGVLITEPPEVCQKVTLNRKLPWWNLRRGAELGGPKTYHRDGNHATRKSKALVPPLDEVTSWSRRKTKQLCVHAQDWCNVPKRNDQPRERRPPPPTHPPCRRCLCCVCCALLCRVRCAGVPSSAQQRTMSSVPFYQTTDA